MLCRHCLQYAIVRIFSIRLYTSHCIHYLQSTCILYTTVYINMLCRHWIQYATVIVFREYNCIHYTVYNNSRVHVYCIQLYASICCVVIVYSTLQLWYSVYNCIHYTVYNNYRVHVYCIQLYTSTCCVVIVYSDLQFVHSVNTRRMICCMLCCFQLSCQFVCIYIYICQFVYSVNTRAKSSITYSITCGIKQHMGRLQFVGSLNRRSLLQKSPIKDTIFCKKATYNLKEPTNRSHPMPCVWSTETRKGLVKVSTVIV